MDVVDLGERALGGVRAAEPRRRPRAWSRVIGVAVAVVVLAVLIAGAVVVSRSPLGVQVTGMRGGPREGWSSAHGITAIADIGRGRIVTTDGITVRAQAAADSHDLWVARDVTDVTQLRDLPGTPWVALGDC
ncbi:MAG: hypothetical protein QM713_08705 [Arachnia sp.]